ncbi:hypothetical protein MFLO_11190 [Listeria floridensis FSL S10-1187]|uniref:Uncharacterized protein n=1 Tax=Listeria floridensis FSL S10-1187 TaxID=1265817 RepID=A0ABP3AW96_9LIST|nr:DUF1128 domain-containing protein [Listeria floridensis]EUJ29147.1 hypothetical protein MFLO_11190 [Listeria floridensis FSL S10-1187]
MNLEQPSQENVNFMLNQITDKLKMVNASVFDHLEADQVNYELLHDLYQLIDRKSSFSPREMQMFAEELRAIRKA